MLDKVAFGGGCHWCTEAVFQSLVGVDRVEQGYVASDGPNTAFSEAVVVHFDPGKIDLTCLIRVHLSTHQSTSNHSRRDEYRSAVYCMSKAQQNVVGVMLEELQPEFDGGLVTEALPFVSFKPSREQIMHYYYCNPERPFCKTYIKPKLQLLLKEFPDLADKEKMQSTGIDLQHKADTGAASE